MRILDNERLRSKLTSMEMRFLWKIEGKTRRDEIINRLFWEKLKITLQKRIEEDNRLAKRLYQARGTDKRER